MQRLQHRRRLSLPHSEIKPKYDVLVIGSGYGGAIAASRMARAGRSVCVLERGKELVPGEYPDTQAEATKQMQVSSGLGHFGSRTGLFDLHLSDDMHVLVGCGLGGTSLINANVSLEAEPAVFHDPIWPQELQDEQSLQKYYDRARAMLKPSTYPAGQPGYPKLDKSQSQEQSARHLGESWAYTPINVNFETFEAGRNHVGMEQNPCSNCGDCCSGCNYGAKNTTLMNYLPDAYNFGAEIFCQTQVNSIRQSADGTWMVFYTPVEFGREKFSAPLLFARANVVILSAGTLGSTEILLRSRGCGLKVSTRLGERFSGNGDVLSFVYNTEQPIHGIGLGDTAVTTAESPPGPCITRPSPSN